MPRRVNLPSADDLFRPTVLPAGGPEPGERRGVHAVPDAPETNSQAGSEEPGKKGASGRIRHDEKMTVYVTSAELLDLERTRLELRGAHGLVLDRGRLVREAIDLVLADFADEGAESLLVRRLLAAREE